jgi:diguanylate cyclase (GGDEF)-like protein
LLQLHSSQEYPISVIVVDIDELKSVNDTQGHSAGDHLIVDAVQILRSVFRSGDVLARIGGDEFVVLLPHTSQAQVIEMIERVRVKLTEHNTAHPEKTVKLSIGTATAEEGKLTESFIAADHNMYAEKALHKSSRG